MKRKKWCAASYVRGNYRIITYADQLSTDGLSVYQNVIENDQNK